MTHRIPRAIEAASQMIRTAPTLQKSSFNNYYKRLQVETKIATRVSLFVQKPCCMGLSAFQTAAPAVQVDAAPPTKSWMQHSLATTVHRNQSLIFSESTTVNRQLARHCERPVCRTANCTRTMNRRSSNCHCEERQRRGNPRAPQYAGIDCHVAALLAVTDGLAPRNCAVHGERSVAIQVLLVRQHRLPRRCAPRSDGGRVVCNSGTVHGVERSDAAIHEHRNTRAWIATACGLAMTGPGPGPLGNERKTI